MRGWRTGKGDEDGAARRDELSAELSEGLLVVEGDARRAREEQQHAARELRPVGDQQRDARAGRDPVLLQGGARHEVPQIPMAACLSPVGASPRDRTPRPRPVERGPLRTLAAISRGLSSSAGRQKLEERAEAAGVERAAHVLPQNFSHRFHPSCTAGFCTPVIIPPSDLLRRTSRVKHEAGREEGRRGGTADRDQALAVLWDAFEDGEDANRAGRARLGWDRMSCVRVGPHGGAVAGHDGDLRGNVALELGTGWRRLARSSTGIQGSALLRREGKLVLQEILRQIFISEQCFLQSVTRRMHLALLFPLVASTWSHGEDLFDGKSVHARQKWNSSLPHPLWNDLRVLQKEPPVVSIGHVALTAVQVAVNV